MVLKTDWSFKPEPRGIHTCCHTFYKGLKEKNRVKNISSQTHLTTKEFTRGLSLFRAGMNCNIPYASASVEARDCAGLNIRPEVPWLAYLVMTLDELLKVRMHK